MVLTDEQVENAITGVINEVKRKLKIKAAIDRDVCPGNINGLTSQILVTLIGRIANALGVNVPNGCYIFKDGDSGEQLSVKQAAKKLIKAVTNGK
jgi:hypothetical protein